MQSLIKSLSLHVPEVTFVQGDTFHWSPKDKTITYRQTDKSSDYDNWALIHEVGHAQLNHTTYTSDLQLLLMEVAAWEQATTTAALLGLKISQEHIQDCLDTYRDWLHQRSTCPTCSISALQVLADQYRCHNCNTEWQVTVSRFCRAYRRKKFSALEKRPSAAPASFI